MTELTLEQWKERALVAEALLEERTQECEKLRVELDAKGGPGIQPGDKVTFSDRPDIWEIVDPFNGDRDAAQRARNDYLSRMVETGIQNMTEAEARMLAAYYQQMQQISDEDLRKMRIIGYDKGKPKEPGRPREHDWKGPDYIQKHAPRAQVENVQAMFLSDKPLARIGFRYRGEDFQMEIDRYELEEYTRKDANRTARMLSDAMASKIGMGAREQDELSLRLMDAIRKLCSPYRK